MKYPDSVAALEELTDACKTSRLRACVVAPNRDIVKNTFRAFLSHCLGDGVTRASDTPQMVAHFENGSAVRFASLDRPAAFAGATYSNVLILLTPELADILESIQNLEFALRIDPATCRRAIIR